MKETAVQTLNAINPEIVESLGTDPGLLTLLMSRLTQVISRGKGLQNLLEVKDRQLLLAQQIGKIESDEQMRAADDLLNWFKGGIDTITNYWKPWCKFGDTVHKSMTGARTAMLTDFLDGVRQVQPKMKAYDDAQEEEKRRIEEAAQKQIAAEQRRAQAEADKLIRFGQVAQAEALLQSASNITMPALPAARIDLEGSTRRGKWIGKVETEEDMIALCLAIGQRKVSLKQPYRGEARPLVVVDQSVLNSLAADNGKSLNFPGVTVEEDFNYSRKAR